MKIVKLLCTLAFLMISFVGITQDVIIRNDGSPINCKVEEVTDKVVKYRDYSNLEGPLYTIKKNEILSINYKNGSIELMDGNASGKSSSSGDDKKMIISLGYNRSSDIDFQNGINGAEVSVEFLMMDQKLGIRVPVSAYFFDDDIVAIRLDVNPKYYFNKGLARVFAGPVIGTSYSPVISDFLGMEFLGDIGVSINPVSMLNITLHAGFGYSLGFNTFSDTTTSLVGATVGIRL